MSLTENDNRFRELKSTVRFDTAQRLRKRYDNPNPVHQFALKRFLNQVAAAIRSLDFSSVLDFGCGEGVFLQQLAEIGIVFEDLTGIDIREAALEEARHRNPNYRFECRDFLKWQQARQYDLVLSIQTLEHLPNPQDFLSKLSQLCGGHAVLTVPNEPWFRLLNLLRFRDLRRLGNHPEHVNLWSKSQFVRLVSDHFKIKEVRTAFPFTIVVGEKRDH